MALQPTAAAAGAGGSPFPFLVPYRIPHAVSIPSTVVHLSRWNNAGATSDPAVVRRRRRADLEEEIRRERRFSTADSILASAPSCPPSPYPAVHTKSRGTPSSPSAPSIPGRASKYSKPYLNPEPSPHPAFRRAAGRISRKRVPPPADGDSRGIRMGDNGLSYHLEGAPFEFQYSYTETPKVKPLALREPPYLPFGPEATPRPWTGRRPLSPSKKQRPEFDSFNLPPPGKKGVKSVQAPGPFLAGAGPKVETLSREEVLGEPLSEDEVNELVEGSLRTRRQLNMGRDGLTHNMLENIHALWKRRRVCKIKCKGVCTVDLDNVCQQLEDKVGGKVIYRKGGVIFLFRGRNYNARTRPRFPLMLWRPVTPVYPRLVQRAPEGLTLDEATEMRKRGRQLLPICKLAKNGVYTDLVQQVKEAFEGCDLVRVNCQGLNKSDCRKIGAKLKDLVPCVLLSFENEHILMWKGRDWKSSLPPLAESPVSERAASDQTVLVSSESMNMIGKTVAVDNGPLSNPEDTVSASDNMDEGLELLIESRVLPDSGDSTGVSSPCMEVVTSLLKQAIESGSAVVLDDEYLNDDIIFRRSVDLAKTAPPSPTYGRRVKKVPCNKVDVEKNSKLDEQLHQFEVASASTAERKSGNKKKQLNRRKDGGEFFADVVPQGSLEVDELAKLLA